MNKNLKKLCIILSAVVFILCAGVAYFFFCSASNGSEDPYVYIDSDDNIDSVCVKVGEVANGSAVTLIRTLAAVSGYDKHIRHGRYAVGDGISSLQLFRNLRNGHQEPVRLTIQSLRTKERLADYLSSQLMMNKDSMLAALNNPDACMAFDLDTSTVISMFIPNTYEVYWDISVKKFMERMKKESNTFWNATRMEQANQLGLSPCEVITMASIVDEETANSDEKPRVAGMYYNRLKINMPLQADPTIKFALQNFSLHRIYRNMLDVDSPYNTYRNAGLPPGPIRIPTIDGIEAVLTLEHHDYIYMCAKEDFSGTHNFATTYAEHLRNAAKYSKALDARGVK